MYMCALSQWLYIRIIMSGLYIYSSTAVVVGCAVLLYGYGVWSLPKVSVWAGANGHCYHCSTQLCSLSAN